MTSITHHSGKRKIESPYISFLKKNKINVNTSFEDYVFLDDNDNHKLINEEETFCKICARNFSSKTYLQKHNLNYHNVNFMQLPTEIIIEILSYLKFCDLKNVRLVNKFMCRTISSKYFKKILFTKRPKNCKLSDVCILNQAVWFKPHINIILKNENVFGDHCCNSSRIYFLENDNLIKKDIERKICIFPVNDVICYYDEYYQNIYDLKNSKEIFNLDKLPNKNDIFLDDSNFTIVYNLIVVSKLREENSTTFNRFVEIYDLNTGIKVFNTEIEKKLNRIYFNGVFIILFSGEETKSYCERIDANRIIHFYKLNKFSMNRVSIDLKKTVNILQELSKSKGKYTKSRLVHREKYNPEEKLYFHIKNFDAKSCLIEFSASFFIYSCRTACNNFYAILFDTSKMKISKIFYYRVYDFYKEYVNLKIYNNEYLVILQRKKITTFCEIYNIKTNFTYTIDLDINNIIKSDIHFIRNFMIDKDSVILRVCNNQRNSIIKLKTFFNLLNF